MKIDNIIEYLEFNDKNTNLNITKNHLMKEKKREIFNNESIKVEDTKEIFKRIFNTIKSDVTVESFFFLERDSYLFFYFFYVLKSTVNLSLHDYIDY